MQERVPHLDGVRGVAILFVVAAHAGGIGLRYGGTTGVTLFFVLSGYLITGLLLRELDGRGSVDLRRFWGRRARRLLPALVPVVLVAPVVGYAFPASLLGPPLVAVLTPAADYVRASGGSMLNVGHMWSLAVEEQFYVLWPAAVAVLWRGSLRRRLAVVLVALVVWRCVLLALGFHAWAYFALDTNAYALVLGALAFTVRDRILAPRLWGVAALVVLVAIAALPVGAGTALWLQPTAAAAGAVAILAAAGLPALAWAPLRFAGRVSYGWYLWHVPLIELVAVDGRGHRSAWVASGVALAVASASFYWVERRFLRSSAAPSERLPVPARA